MSQYSVRESATRRESVVVTSAIKNVVQTKNIVVISYVERNSPVERTSVMKCVILDFVLHAGEQVSQLDTFPLVLHLHERVFKRHGAGCYGPLILI